MRPVNVAFVGPSASGKSRNVEVAAALFPASAIYRLDGASQLALVYSDESFEHRSIFLAEADSLPEDGAAASALRAIVTNSRMVYVTVEKRGGTLAARSIEKEGPTGLCTTSIRPPREQFGTRMLLVSVPDDERHHRVVLEAQAASVNGAHATFDPGPFQAHQEWLQLAGDRAVTVPFAQALARNVPAKATRTMRDFPQLLSLIQASAILHQRHRERDDRGHIVATLADYSLVRDLVKDSYAAVSQSGLTPAIRETVETVARLLAAPGIDGRLTFRQISDALELAPSSGKWRIDRAIALGYLVNDETRRGQPARIHLGDPLPEEQEALPPPAALIEADPADPLEIVESASGGGTRIGLAADSHHGYGLPDAGGFACIHGRTRIAPGTSIPLWDGRSRRCADSSIRLRSGRSRMRSPGRPRRSGAVHGLRDGAGSWKEVLDLRLHALPGLRRPDDLRSHGLLPTLPRESSGIVRRRGRRALMRRRTYANVMDLHPDRRLP